MATSGSYNLNATGLDILTESLGLVGFYSPGESLDNTEVADGLRSLEFMLKANQQRWGVHLNKELSLIFQNDTIRYSIGPTGDHCAENMVKTELAADAASAATSITIDATTGITDSFDRDGILASSTPGAAGALTLDGALVTSGIATLTSNRKVLVYSDGNDAGVTFTITGQNTIGTAVTEVLTGPNTTTVYSANEYRTISSIAISGAGTGNIEIGQVGDHIGIELDSDDMQWTNIGNALSTTTTLIAALTGAAATDNHVYSYKIKSERPTLITEARLHRSDDLERPIIIVGRADYQLLSNKTNEAPVNQVWYDGQLTNGVATVWPEPDDVQDWIKFTGRYPIQDVDSTANNLEVAQEWYEPIAWQLAVRLFPKYNKGAACSRPFKADADEFLAEAMATDSNNDPVFIKMAPNHGR